MSEDPAPKRISGSYQIPIPRDELLALLSEVHGPYSMARARLSLALDRDAGREKSLREYAALWGWSKKKVEYNIAGLRKAVEHWNERRPRLSLKDHAKGTEGGQKGDSVGDNSTGDLNERAVSGDTSGDTYGTVGGQLLNNPNPREEEIQRGGDAREDRGTLTEPLPEIDPWNPAFGFPQKEDVIRFARENGATDDLAERGYRTFMASGWRDWRNAPVYHWGYAILNWLDSQKNKPQRNGNAKPKHHTEKSSYERRLDGVDREEHERNLDAIRRGDFGLAPRRPDESGGDPELAGRVPV